MSTKKPAIADGVNVCREIDSDNHTPCFPLSGLVLLMEAFSGRKTIQEIAADHALHPIQVSQ